MILEDIMNQLGVEKYDVIQLIAHMKVVRAVLTGEIMVAEEEMAR